MKLLCSALGTQLSCKLVPSPLTVHFRPTFYLSLPFPASFQERNLPHISFLLLQREKPVIQSLQLQLSCCIPQSSFTILSTTFLSFLPAKLPNPLSLHCSLLYHCVGYFAACLWQVLQQDVLYFASSMIVLSCHCHPFIFCHPLEKETCRPQPSSPKRSLFSKLGACCRAAPLILIFLFLSGSSVLL